MNWTPDRKQLGQWGFDGNVPNSLVVTASLEEEEDFFSTLPSHVNHNRALKLPSENCPLVVAEGEKVLILPVLLKSKFIQLLVDRGTCI